MERAVAIPRQRISDRRGRLLVEVDLAELWDGVGACFALPRPDLHDVLLEGAREAGIRIGVEVRALSAQNGTLSVELGDGTSDDYDLVVGADGVHSTVRRLAFGEHAIARPVGQVGWRFLADCPAEITTWSVLLGHRTAFLTIPMGNVRVYCYGDVVSASGEDRDDDLGSLFSGFAEPVPSLIDSIPDRSLMHRSTIEEVALDSWVRGRVVLVGDARMRPRPTWPRAPRWRSKTRWCSPNACSDPTRFQTPWRRSRPAAGRERTGSVRRRIAATELATYRRRSETRSYAPSAKRSFDELSTSSRRGLRRRRGRGPHPRGRFERRREGRGTGSGTRGTDRPRSRRVGWVMARARGSSCSRSWSSTSGAT